MRSPADGHSSTGRSQPKRKRSSESTSLIRPAEGPQNAQSTLLNSCVTALLEANADHAPPVHSQEQRRSILLNRMFPAPANREQRPAPWTEIQQQQWRPTTTPLQPPTSHEVGAGKGKQPLTGEESTSERAAPAPAPTQYNPLTKRMMAMKGEAYKMGMEMVRKMPSVSTLGVGPNAKTVQGFLYGYGKEKEELRIMCSCHGCFLSPAGFVKHSGGVDIPDEPMKHISVCYNLSPP